MMAVECEREDITEYIDEVNGALWPEELVPRKSRHVSSRLIEYVTCYRNRKINNLTVYSALLFLSF